MSTRPSHWAKNLPVTLSSEWIQRKMLKTLFIYSIHTHPSHEVGPTTHELLPMREGGYVVGV
jgi:hypothetical protein